MQRLLFSPVNSSSLAAYRILFGLLNVVGLVRFWYLGWIERCFVNPEFMFKYWGFEWVKLWPGDGIYIHFAVLIAASACFALGLLTRVMSVVFFLGFTYIELLDQSNFLNHYYLLCLMGFINMFLPLNARWSLDNVVGLSVRREWVPAWTLNWLRFQVGTVYFFAGMAKLGTDWLLRAQPLNIWLTASREMPVLGWFFQQGWTHYAMSWSGFLFDSSIVFFMLNRRTRPFAYAVIVFFHSMTYLLFNIGMFPFIMVTLALVFFDDDWPLKLMRRARPRERNISFQWRPAVAVGLGAYALIQLALPLRPWIYPGNTLWNEDGMRFSWRVMIREKNGEAVFRVVDRASGRTWMVTGSQFLIRHQETEMATNPDMILQFAHFLRDLYRDRGFDVAVYAETMTSFNGRLAKPLIDPNVDLTQERESFWPKSWVTAAPSDEPRRLNLKKAWK